MPARYSFVLGAIVIAVGVGGSAQGPQQDALVPPSNLVRTEVFASLDGQPVTDLRPDEVQILEDGAPQVPERFELVQPRESPEGLSVVVFVDSLHTPLEGARPPSAALARALEESLPPGTRIALTSPELVAAELTFGSRAEAVATLSQPDWSWVRRTGAAATDPKEALYDSCFAAERGGADRASEMKARRREKASLDALDDLLAHVDGLGLQRTVVLLVSDGWRMFGENQSLAQPRRERGGGVTTPFGRIGGGRPDPQAVSGVSRVECEADVRALARLDHSQRLRDLSEVANRSLVSFLAVSSVALGYREPASGAGTPVGQAREAGLDSLRFLADNTMGAAVTTASPTTTVAGRLVGEAQPFYLVRYRSTNTKLDGRFRTISTRTTRPELRLRARRGYRGATAEEMLSRRTGEPRRDRSRLDAEPPTNPAAAPSFRIRTAAWASTDGSSFWVVGELEPRLRRELVWSGTVKAEVTVLAADGRTVATRALDVPSGENSFALRVPEQGDIPDAEYAVRVRVSPEADATVALSDTARVMLARAPRGLSEPLVWRRGLSTGPRFVQTATSRFQRQDRLRLEFATRLDSLPTGRLVDRAGNILQVPVVATSRPDEGDEGLRWIVAEVALAPLAQGEYEVEVEVPSGGTHSFKFTLVP